MDGVEAVDGLSGRVLLIGFGRFGQIISQPLLARGHSLSIIESDPDAIRDAKDFGFKVWYRDGARLDILHAAGAADASLIIAAAGDAEATTRIAELARHEFPTVPVLARAFDREHALKLVEAGVDFQIRETFESALLVGREALMRLGDTPEEAAELIGDIRQRDAERFALETAGGIYAGRSMIHGNVAQEQQH